MIFANPDGGSLEPSESSFAPPSCAKIDLRSGSGRGAIFTELIEWFILIK
jgi:hypothetical protein